MSVALPPYKWSHTWLKPLYLWLLTVRTALNLATTALGNVTGMNSIADPGASGAIPVTVSGVVDLVTAGAETRTVAAPPTIGEILVLNADTIVTSCTIAFAAAFDVTPHAHIAFTATGQNATFVAATIGGVKTWRLVSNEGGTLST